MSVVVLVTAVLLLLVPGALLARLTGARTTWSLVTGPALTWGAVGLGAAVVPAVGLRWRPGTALAWWAALAAAAVAVRVLATALRRLGAGAGPRPGADPRSSAGPVHRHRPGRRARLLAGPAPAAAGVVAAACVPALLARRSGVGLASVCQLWDAVWHANLTAFIAATGSSGPTTAPGQLLGAGWREGTSFYPDALHALAALVVDVTGASPLVGLSAVVAVAYALLLPLGVAALTWVLTRGSSIAAGTAAVVSELSLAFPTDQWWRGVWSYGVALAATPLACALVLVALRGELGAGALADDGPGGDPRRPGATASRASAAGLVATAGRAAAAWTARAGLPAALLGGLAVGGLAALQPAAAVVAAIVLGSWLLGRLLWVRWWVSVPVALVVALALTRVPGLVWGVVAHSPVLASLASFRYVTLAYWQPALRQVLGQVTPVDPSLGYGVPVQAPQHALEAVVLTSVAIALTRREGAWLAAAWALVVAAATSTVTPLLPVLQVITLFFYASSYRLVAVSAVLGAVLVGVALDRVLGWWGAGRRRWAARASTGGGARMRRRASAAVAAVAAVAVVAGLVVLAQGTLARGQVRMRAGFADRVVGPSQVAVMRVLARQPLPSGARVLNDPVDGSPWMYALTGVEPVFTHYSAGTVPDDLAHLVRHLAHADTNARVQDELRRWRICYVYTNDTLVTARRTRAKGFVGLARSHALQLVARSGGAAAYRVVLPGTSCASGEPAARTRE